MSSQQAPNSSEKASESPENPAPRRGTRPLQGFVTHAGSHKLRELSRRLISPCAEQGPPSSSSRECRAGRSL